MARFARQSKRCCCTRGAAHSNVAVTGAAGYIGSRVVFQLQRDHPDWTVTALNNFYLGYASRTRDPLYIHEWIFIWGSYMNGFSYIGGGDARRW